MFCLKCGDSLSPDAAFCSKCGTPVTAQVPAEIAPAKAKKGSKAGEIATYAVGGVVALIFGSAIFGMLGGGDRAETGQSSSVSSPNSSSAETQDISAPGIGEGWRFESGVEIYAESLNESPSIPNEFIIDPDGIKGQLVSIRFYLKNGSNEEVNISNSSLSGRIGPAMYEPIAILSTSGDWYVYEPVGAGLETTFDVYFDIPAGKTLTGAMFQTSLFSGEQVEFSFG